jgi:2-dehydro-3-deoxygluconokinase
MSEPLQLTTLGEALIVMDPLSKGPLRHVGRFEKHLGGAEFNVAVGLSRLGHGVGWAGRLGDDEFGEEILAFARGEEVDVSRAGLDPEAPTGLYFKEWRALGQLRVHYYRMGSAASRMQIDNLDVQYLLSGQILHLTGITAALSESCHELIDRLISAANDRGVTVSFDVNVRRGCWTCGIRGRFWALSPPAPTSCFSRRTRRSSCSAVAIRGTSGRRGRIYGPRRSSSTGRRGPSP